MKKTRNIIILLLTIIFIISSNILYQKQNQIYKENYNQTLNTIIYKLTKKYPELTKKDIIEILNSNNLIKENTLKDYSINLETDNLILKNDKDITKLSIINNTIILTFIILITTILIINSNHNKRKIKQLTKCLEQINRKNYQIQIDDNTEDELSILKNEIYKTTIMLKEQAENSLQDKINLKTSLEDISHQLKTPLTSINIMLDNLLDNQDMDKETRIEFIKDIKREINNINYLVQTLLKLSRFEANTVKYNNELINIQDLITKVTTNVSVLCDLKNITIQTNNYKNIYLTCDLYWQTEALTNILKNCIEHSQDGSYIYIDIIQNKIYTQITIKDNGEGISKEDIKHIFQRFYKGTNSKKDSIGIGLPLAKTIIEKNNGNLEVVSQEQVGTTFTIKYFK